MGLLLRRTLDGRLPDARERDDHWERGVDYLRRLGPSRTDLYFNYYASQVLLAHGGSAWQDWNEFLREHLVRTQATSSHERGSWHFDDAHGSQGGRLYTTALATLVLEVYYRHVESTPPREETAGRFRR